MGAVTKILLASICVAFLAAKWTSPRFDAGMFFVIVRKYLFVFSCKLAAGMQVCPADNNVLGGVGPTVVHTYAWYGFAMYKLKTAK